MEIKKIDSVTIGVRDLERAAKFYTETLGLPEIWRMDERKMRGVGAGDNSATINLQQVDAAGMEVIIQVDRVDDARATLEKKGVRFDGATQTIEGIGKIAGFRDPDGNRISLLDYSIEHGEDAAAPR